MIEGKLRPIRDRVLVVGMHFGETKTAGGIIIGSDDGKAHGVKPRWCQVYAKGHENEDEYQKGDWILVEHGRWTRKIQVKDETGEELEIQMVENEAILAYSNERPAEKDLAYYGQEYSDGASATFDPSMFGAQ